MSPITTIKKRTGDIVAFDGERIRTALTRAFASAGNYNTGFINEIADQVLNVINNKFDGKGIPSVEEVQDIVEILLIHNDLPDIAKNYILYRHEHGKMREQLLKTEAPIAEPALENK